MKAWHPTLFLPLAFAAHADAPPVVRDPLQDPFALPAPQQAPPPGARPSDEAIRAAVRATLEEMPDSSTPMSGQALSGGPYREFARKFALAAKPHCLGPDPLRHQPHSTVVKTIFGDFAVGVGGIYALPFWGAAVFRGKCNWTR
ncbi:hypothetical protein LK542_09885 [Massilia sp. IC2-477]|uniref:hypothetical protein n=1 Tax=Massilia sp. IC2-477 TaxID=2887198 RepID=UPI001D12695D|nr:hypothetical protein [Massilia sp. IC2-477]MCC2955922.1 hypothetical protein [Massilia sp. IC2-477]